MDKFIIKSIEDKPRDFRNDNYLIQDEFSYEITLIQVQGDKSNLESLISIQKNGGTFSLLSSDYVSLITPFKDEFINFMMDRYPDKIVSNPKGWNNLLVAE